MKKIFYSALSLAAVLTFSACQGDSGAGDQNNYDNNLDEGMEPHRQDEMPRTLDRDSNDTVSINGNNSADPRTGSTTGTDTGNTTNGNTTGNNR